MARSTSPSPGSGVATSRAAMTCRNADLARLGSRSCIIDGEAVCCGDDGVPSFDRIRYRRHDASVVAYLFYLKDSGRFMPIAPTRKSERRREHQAVPRRSAGEFPLAEGGAAASADRLGNASAGVI